MTLFRPHNCKQLDGSATQDDDCGPSVTVDLIEKDWLGAKRPSNDAIRKSLYPDVNGTNGDQLVEAAAAVSGTRLVHREALWGDFLETQKTSRGVALIIRNSVLHGTSIDCSPYYDDLHWIYLNGQRVWSDIFNDYALLKLDPLGDGRRAGIPTDPHWVREALIRKAALAVQNDGYVDFVMGRPTAGAVKKALYAGGEFHAKPNSDSTSKGALAVGTLITVAATVTGGSWTIKGHTGKQWYRLASGVYVARGYFRGPTGAYA